MENLNTVAIKEKNASGPGAIAGYQLTCTCGLVWSTSLIQIAQNESFEHLTWHINKDKKDVTK